MEALGGALPSGDLPLRLSTVPLAVTAKREQAVVLTVGLPSVQPTPTEEFAIQWLLFDGQGRRQLMSQARDVKVAGDAPLWANRWKSPSAWMCVPVGISFASAWSAGATRQPVR